MASDFTKLSCLGSLRSYLPASVFKVKDLVAVVFSKLCCLGILRCDRLLSSPPMHHIKASYWLRFRRYLFIVPCFLRVSKCFRRDKLEPKKDFRRVFDVSLDQRIVSSALVKTKPWSTHQQLVARCLRISRECSKFKLTLSTTQSKFPRCVRET